MKKSNISKDRSSMLKTIARFDQNKKVEDVTDSGKSRKNIKPHTVFLQVLIEEICRYRETDERRRRLLYNEIYKNLCEAQFIDSAIELGELATVRHHLADEFHQYIEKIQRQIPVTAIQNEISYHGYFEHQQELTNVCQTNRYNETFEELEVIARGGYGVVCKARHKVDCVIYAVKKVEFKYKNDPEFRKVLREAKSIAALKHPNVVSYNNAWIDFNYSSESNSSESSSKSSEGSSNQNESSRSSEKSSESGESLNENTHTPNLNNHSAIFEDDSNSKSLPLSNELCQSHHTTALTENIRRTYINHRSSEENGLQDTHYKLSHQEVCISSLAEANNQVMHLSEMTKVNSVSMQTFEICDKENHCVPTIATVPVHNNFTGIQGAFASNSGIITSVTNYKAADLHLLKDSSAAECKALLPTFQTRPWNLRKLNVNSTLYIQMEHCDCDLRLWLDQRSKKAELPFEMDVMDIFKQILCGVAHIHFKSIIHRDLKPKNVFFSKEQRVMKIGDFGLATLVEYTSEDLDRHQLTDNLSAGLGTMPYAAPEQRSKKKYDCKVDIYSLGILLVELLNNFQTKMEFSKAVEDILKGSFPPDMIKKCTNHISLVKKLIRRNPIERPSAKEILELPVLKNEAQECENSSCLYFKKLIDDFKEILLQRDSEIADLKQLLEEKENVISNQRAELQTKDQQIADLTHAMQILQSSR